MSEKPECKLIGENSNVFNLVGKACTALRRAGQHEEAKKMSSEVFASKSYSEAFEIIQKYVKVI